MISHKNRVKMARSKLNLPLIMHIVSIVLLFEGLFMLASVVVSDICHESITGKLLIAFSICFFSGLAVNIVTGEQRRVEPTRKESIIIVSISWFVLGVAGTLPYLLTHTIPGFTNALFESISGFTTTGSSILTDIESLPKSILFWRSLTHWIGGMGIIVLVVAIMPFLKINGIFLFNSETSSAATEQISTRIRKMARSLWLVYVGLTIVEVLFLLMGKMPFFDSVCHSFATIATGGFSTKNTSITNYSPYIQYVVTLFMLLSGINFALHVLMLKGKFREVAKNEELRLYLLLIFVVTGLITLILFWQSHVHFEKAFRDALFQVVSILTATGFATADYMQWPTQAIFLIGLLMLVGASAGSTGGGVKVVRHLVALKRIRKAFIDLISPSSIHIIHYNGHKIEHNFISKIMGFVFLYYLIAAIGTFLMTLMGIDPETSFGAVITCMGGIGPGFGSVGPASNFFHLPGLAKYLLAVLMVIGRLEIYAILVLFTRSFWID